MTVARRAVARPPGATAAPALALTALVLLAGCAAGDAATTADEPAATSAAPPVATPTPTPTTAATTTTTTTTTTLPARVVGDEIGAIEVSARLLLANGGAEHLLAIGADAVLAETPLPDDVDRSAAWCSVAASPDHAGAPDEPAFVLRVGSPAVDRAEGGLDRFELVADADPSDGDAVDGPVPATIRFVLDARPGDAPVGEPVGEFATVAAEMTLDADSGTGSFRGELPDGGLIEGAFRCD